MVRGNAYIPIKNYVKQFSRINYLFNCAIYVNSPNFFLYTVYNSIQWLVV